MPPSLFALGEGSHGSILNGNYAPNRLSSAWKPTDDVADLPGTGLPAVESAAGKKRGRRPLPADLPRERVEYDLADDEKACPCCNSQMHRMGEAVTEQLHIEVKAKVLQNVRFKCERDEQPTAFGVDGIAIALSFRTSALPASA